jgi:transcriptional regulator with XRE-family HTH domain
MSDINLCAESHAYRNLSTPSSAVAVDKVLSFGSLPLVASAQTWLADFQARIAWIMKDRRLSRRAFSLRAGLSPSHVSMILRGEVADAISVKALYKLAEAGNVRPEWLAFGHGEPEHNVADESDNYPNRQQAFIAARYLGGYAPEDFATVRAHSGFYGPDPEPRQWLEKLDRARRDREDPLPRPPRGTPVEDDVPPRNHLPPRSPRSK